MDRSEAEVLIWRTAASGNLQETVTVGGTCLGCTVLLGDPILAIAAANFPLSPSVSWEELITLGRAPDFRPELRAPAPEFPECPPQYNSWCWTDPDGQPVGIVLDLPTSSGSCYHLAVSGASLFLPEIPPLLTAFCEALTVVLNRAEQPVTGQLNAEQFLYRLLEGDLSEDRLLEERARLAGVPTVGFFRLLCVNIENYRPKGVSISTVAAELASVRGDITAICRGYLVFLQSFRSEADGNSPAFLSSLDFLLKKYGLHGGRSRLFRSLREVPGQCDQAKQLLSLASVDEGHFLHDHSRLWCHLLLISLPESEQGLDACHPIVRKLAELDRVGKTDFIETLKVYLECALRAPVAAARLHIHRNTLDYRLHKMEEQIPIDWSDGALMFRLYLSICRLELSERLR